MFLSVRRVEGRPERSESGSEFSSRLDREKPLEHVLHKALTLRAATAFPFFRYSFPELKKNTKLRIALKAYKDKHQLSSKADGNSRD
jgi:hypothetical protein